MHNHHDKEKRRLSLEDFAAARADMAKEGEKSHLEVLSLLTGLFPWLI